MNKNGIRKQKDILKKLRNNNAANIALEIAQVGYDIVTFDVLGIMMDTVNMVNAAYDHYQRKKLEKLCDGMDLDIPVDQVKIKQ